MASEIRARECASYILRPLKLRIANGQNHMHRRHDRHFTILALMLVLSSLLSVAAAPAAWSRPWKPTNDALAQDYLLITDQRDGGLDTRMVFWIASPMVPDKAAREILDKYVLIGVVRMYGSVDGTFSFEAPETLQVADGSAQALHSLSESDMPPVVMGLLTALQAAFGQSLGPMGQGVRWFVFEGGTVHPCKAGGLSVPFADEIYTYETPIPGCP